jgi:hypothetical protein
VALGRSLGDDDLIVLSADISSGALLDAGGRNLGFGKGRRGLLERFLGRNMLQRPLGQRVGHSHNSVFLPHKVDA